MGDRVWSEEELVWVLFLADFAFYAEHHRSITGLVYVKGEHGPLLVGDGPLPNNTDVGEEESRFLDEVCEACEKLSREEIQRQIVGSLAYVLTDMGEVIDYELAYYGAGLDLEDDDEVEPFESDPEFIAAIRKIAQGAGG